MPGRFSALPIDTTFMEGAGATATEEAWWRPL